MADAVHDTDNDESDGVTTTLAGAAGGAIGVAVAEGDDDVEVPAEFVDLTVNVYVVPLVKPVTVYAVAVVATKNEPLR